MRSDPFGSFIRREIPELKRGGEGDWPVWYLSVETEDQRLRTLRVLHESGHPAMAAQLAHLETRLDGGVQDARVMAAADGLDGAIDGLNAYLAAGNARAA
jgi:hypothetical protein